MYERFTDRAIRVMRFADEEAHRFCHEYIGTEHILLGLLKQDLRAGAIIVIRSLDIDLQDIRTELEKKVLAGPDLITMGKLPQTPRAKKVIEFAMEAARNLRDEHLGTEHILLGLLQEQEGIAAQVLMHFGLTYDKVRATVLDLLRRGKQGLDLKLDDDIDGKFGTSETSTGLDSEDSLQCAFFRFSGIGRSAPGEVADMNQLLGSGIEVHTICQSSTAEQTHISIFYRKK